MASMEMESEYSMEMAVESMEFHGNLRDGRDQKFEYPQGPSNNQKYIYILAHISRTGFQLFSLTYVSIVMRYPFADILVPPVPLD